MVGLKGSEGLVPQSLAEEIALRKARSIFGDSISGHVSISVLNYYDFSGQVTAYAFVFSLTRDPFLSEQELITNSQLALSRSEEAAERGDLEGYRAYEDLGFGVGRYATVVVSARYDQVPILECANCLPRYYTRLYEAQTRAKAEIGKRAQFSKVYYLAPQAEFFEFVNDDERILIHAYALKPFRLEELLPSLEKSEGPHDPRWFKLEILKEIAIIDEGYLDSVPFCLWSYGCSPTASAMILWYWDSRGYGRLVDHFFDRRDSVLLRNVYNLPNIQRELAVGMHTDSLYSGGTSIYNIAPGHLYAANTINGYRFSSTTYGPGNSSNHWLWERIVEEIDAGRPCHWAVLYYLYAGYLINHSVCAVGYEIDDAGDSMVVVHNTWDTAEHRWALYTIYNGQPSVDYVYSVIPDGEEPDDVQLTFPKAITETVLKGLKGRIAWERTGANIDHFSLFWAEDDHHESWQPLTPSVSGEEHYWLWIPEETGSARINIEAYGRGGRLLAADGSIGKVMVQEPPSGDSLSLLGYYNTAGDARSVWADNQFLYLADGGGRFSIFDVSDSTFPYLIASYQLSDYLQDICYQAPFIYLAGRNSGLHIFDLSEPSDPRELGLFDTPGQAYQLCVEEDLVYIADGTKGLRIINIADPHSPLEIGHFSTERIAYDVLVSGDRTWIAIPSAGILELDVGDPTNPRLISEIETQGPAIALAQEGDYLYVAEGGKGVEIFRISERSAVGSFDTPGQARALWPAGEYLYIADGSGGMRLWDVSDPAKPVEIGWHNSWGGGYGVCATRSLAFLADGSDGIYILKSPVTIPSITEPSPTIRPGLSLIGVPNPARGLFQIQFQLSQPSPISLSIYDVSGRLVRKLQEGWLSAGTYEVEYLCDDIQGRPVPAGVYFCQLVSAGTSLMKKLIIIK
jgi:hypothetical protein